MTTSFDVVIVGGGHAGAQCAVALRQSGFEGSIGLIGEEDELPYERPPLSKEYFTGEKSFERLLIRPAQFWQDRHVTMLLGRRAVEVDAHARIVRTKDGSEIGFGKLVWATGGKPRRLGVPGHDLAGIHAVRNRQDVDTILRSLESTRRVIIVGGGYIGLEAASALTKFGKEVVVLEALDRVLARVAGEPLSRYFERYHRAHGVEIRLSAATSAFEGAAGRLTGVRLADGSFLAGDMAIVGVGIVPAVEPLLAAGAAGGNGVAVDAFCRTSLSDIYAIGDCALHENHYAAGATIRLESVQNANDQATVAARAIVGDFQPYRALPWFWSNQYDLRLQTVGLSMGHDAIVTRGDLDAGSFSILYLRNGKVVALDCVNATKDYVQGRKIIESGGRVDLARLADAAVPLKELAVLGA